ncbi:MAG: M20 family metallopeptidase, partial [Pseudomonadota bacterium]
MIGDTVAWLRELVAFASVSSRSNLAIAEFIAERFRDVGARVELMPDATGKKANVFASLGPDVDGGIVLSGHMDVVPALEAGWESDPFRLTECEGTLVGRGSTDMKGFLALAVNALARLDVDSLRQPLALLLTYDEEVGTLGAKRFVDTWPASQPLPRRTIIGEPTSLKVVRLHKGHLSYRVRFRGRAAHSGFPELGVNALEPLARAVLGLRSLARELRAERPANSESFPSVPYAPLNVATVHGGIAVNVVPEQAELTFGLRHLPGMEPAELERRIREALEKELGRTPFELRLECESPPMMAPEGGDFHHALERVTGCAAGEGAS